MGEQTAIAWTDHTFNPWLGCLKVSPGCEHCYAETLVVNRMRLNVWGPPKTTQRKRTAASTWKHPLAWNNAAKKAGVRRRVFCASLADVFEDHPQVAPWREELFALIEQTPHLDWQLLTKRPEDLLRFLPQKWIGEPRANVWLGTTVESQEVMVGRVLSLAAVPARVRFLSCEPLLTPLDLALFGTLPRDVRPRYSPVAAVIHWVIVGGESGPGARPFDLAWARSIVRQCEDAQVACFVKQLGSHPRCHRDDAIQLASKGRWISDSPGASYGRATPYDRAGADPAEWPEDLRVQQFPEEQS